MPDYRSNIGPSSTRRRIAFVIAVVGALFVGNHLANAWPRSTRVAYEVGPSIEEIDVDYVRDGSAVKSVRFARRSKNSEVFRHVVGLRPGTYEVHITLYGRTGPAIEEVRGLSVPAGGVARFDLRATTVQPE